MVVGSVATLGYMYYASTQMKQQEGKASIYSAFFAVSSSCCRIDLSLECADTSQGAAKLGTPDGSSDSRLGSAGVRAAVQGEKRP